MFRTRLAYVIPSVAAFVVAAASFTLSFVALRDVAAQVGAVPPELAWLVPIVVDGGILAASASLWAASYRQVSRDKVAYATVIVLLAFSVVVNASHAGPQPLAKAIASLPPIVLLATLELVASAHRRTFVASASPLPSSADPSAGPAPDLTSSREFRDPLPAAPSAKTSPPSPTPQVDPALLVQDHVRIEPVVDVRKDAGKGTRADEVRAVFDELVLQGMDPSDPAMVAHISRRVDVTPAYVRRLIKPLREETFLA